MITEDYVSFEIAKLLKEKGFDFCCEFQYINCSSGHPFLIDIRDDAGCYYKNSEIGQDEYSAPTLQMVTKWLREVYHWHIFVVPKWEDVEYMPGEWEEKMVGYQYVIAPVGDAGIKKECPTITALTPESACEAAIKYCLENLI